MRQKMIEPEEENGLTSLVSAVKDFFKENKVEILGGVQCSETKVKILNNELSSIESKYNIEDKDVDKIYLAVPDAIVECVKPYVVALSDSMSYEEILRYFMKLSADIDNPLSQAMDIAKIDKYFGEQMVYNSVCSFNSGTLAIIWSALILSLYKKHINEISNFDLKKIIQGGVAFSLTFGVMLMQYEHRRSGSPSNCLRKLSSQYYKFREQQNKLPDLLNLDKMKNSISEASYNDKLRMGQLFNMVYTFRIGDCCISKLGHSHSYIDVRTIIQSAWPLPTDYDISKMYRLYTESYIY